MAFIWDSGVISCVSSKRKSVRMCTLWKMSKTSQQVRRIVVDHHESVWPTPPPEIDTYESPSTSSSSSSLCVRGPSARSA